MVDGCNYQSYTSSHQAVKLLKLMGNLWGWRQTSERPVKPHLECHGLKIVEMLVNSRMNHFSSEAPPRPLMWAEQTWQRKVFLQVLKKFNSPKIKKWWTSLRSLMHRHLVRCLRWPRPRAVLHSVGWEGDWLQSAIAAGPACLRDPEMI